MCDCLVALPVATGAATLFAKNSDRPPDERQRVEWSPSRHGERSTRCTYLDVDAAAGRTLDCVISRPLWCWGAEHGVNAAGLAIGNEAIYTTLDPRSAAPALTGLDLVRLGLERALTAADAVDVIVGLLERYGQGGSGHDPHGAGGPKPYWSSFLIADPSSAFVLETSGREWASEAVEATRAISNRTTIEWFDAEHRHPRQDVQRFVDPRLDASNRALRVRPLTAEVLLDHLASHDADPERGWSVCMHARDDDGTVVETTTASLVAELRDDSGSTLWMSDGAPCTVTTRQFRFDEAEALLPATPIA
jgi:secernin